MNLKLKNAVYIICGASDGFGKETGLQLIEEGAHIIAIARDREKLSQCYKNYQSQAEIMALDLTHPESAEIIFDFVKNKEIAGIVVNSSGPPAKFFKETTIEDWDCAYKQLVRWKVETVNRLIPLFEKQLYGRIVFIESASVKQPIDNMMLSTSLRLAVVGFSKSISMEFADKGITSNILAPGFHLTAAIERVFNAKSKKENISIEEAREKFIQGIATKKIGDPHDFAKLALFLLSPVSSYITGQTFTVDGGMNKSVFG